MTRIVLVRHGEARCNVEGVMGGMIGCGGLTDEGVRQVMSLRDRLARFPTLIGATPLLYASPLLRARQTADILSPLIIPDGRVIVDEGLRELDPGEADGFRWDELADRWGEPDWQRDPGRPIAPGGESWLSFVERSSGRVARLAVDHPDRTVVVACHAGVIEATVIAFLGAGDGRGIGLLTGHASMTVWQISGSHWTLRRYNDQTPTHSAATTNSRSDQQA